MPIDAGAQVAAFDLYRYGILGCSLRWRADSVALSRLCRHCMVSRQGLDAGEDLGHDKGPVFQLVALECRL